MGEEREGPPDEGRGESGATTPLVAPTAASPDGGDEATPAGPPGLPARYAISGLIDVGGMGEVWRATDRLLDRAVAVKISEGGDPREASVTAGLDHPGVVAVYDAGRLDDGRTWYAMREVRGRTLTALGAAVRRASAGAGAWAATADGWTLQRLVGALETAARAVAYAHDAGVVHRDLKPDNVLVGPFGEVQVIDWGVAARAGSAGPGRFVGTVAFAAPEQARSPSDPVAPAQDVFALGACLYALLSGWPPRPGSQAAALARLRAGPPPDLLDRETDAPAPPEELVAATRAAMDPAAAARPTAAAFADALRAWLDGVARRERARAHLRDGLAAVAEVAAAREAAAEARAAAAAALDGVPPWAPEEDKVAGWDHEDAARDREQDAVAAEARAESHLQAALSVDPDLPEAHAALADLYRQRVVQAERRGEADSAVRAARRLADHDRTGQHAAFLSGDGALTLVTEPPGAEVLVERYERRRRRLVPVPQGSLGRTPLLEVSLPKGSYRLRLRLPGRPDVLYPVHLGRGEHWHGVAPGETAPTPVALPDALGPDEIYVPAGWAVVGGDDRAVDPLSRRRVWIDGFVVQRDPVTVGAWADWLEALWAAGQEEEAHARLPQHPEGTSRAAPLALRLEEGRVVLASDASGNTWRRGEPIGLIRQADAVAWAAARRDTTGLPWRLPHGLEREKAARGVDGRAFPWGDHMEPRWTCMAQSHADQPRRFPVGQLERDLSPYGARGMAGNVRDRCRNGYRRDGDVADGARLPPQHGPLEEAELHIVRGGAWLSAGAFCRAASRFADGPERRLSSVGVRLVRSV